MSRILQRNFVVFTRRLLPGKNRRCNKIVRCLGSTSRCDNQVPQLSTYDINLLLRENEYSHIFTEGETAVLSYETNQLGANSPCEDTRSEASFLHKNAFICAIFDGHGGAACSQVISKRLLRYLGASLIDRQLLQELITKGYTSQSFLKCHNDKMDFVNQIKELYEQSFTKYVEKLSSQEAKDRSTEITNAFLELDDHISDEAIKNADNMRTMSVAMSGAVACVAHIDKLDLHLANTGDCSAVLGSLCATSGKWIPKKLSIEHNTDNKQEVQRILSEHPNDEHDTAIRNDRLLSQLAPLRAFGDFRYKWTNEVIDKYVVPTLGDKAVAPHYYTPPYLTAKPEVTHHVLDPQDKFLVIGSDGLWDFLSPSQVVNLVGQHLTSKKILEPLKLPAGEVTLKEVSEILAERKTGRKNKPLDQNSATHLIRYALGNTEIGIENSKIAYYLSLPQDVVRYYRDDITITVVYFNSDFISKCAEEKA